MGYLFLAIIPVILLMRRAQHMQEREEPIEGAKATDATSRIMERKRTRRGEESPGGGDSRHGYERDTSGGFCR
jgi:hypothetical protein